MWHAISAVVGLTLTLTSSANALQVVTPALSQVVIADRTYTVEWTGTSDDRFEIDLYYCGSFCMEGECGEWVTALCPYGEDGCPDNEGDYDIVMPEPLMGTSGSGYKVRVADADDPDDVDCSDDFYLMVSDEAPGLGEVDGPYLTVTSPKAGDSADAGEVYTVEWDYDNGVGSRVDRFKIDLYTPGDDTGGDCGTWVTNLCDKESIGCKDSMGDYDVDIPHTVSGGSYVIRVGRFEDDSLYGCSEAFEIVGSGGVATGEGEGEGEGSASSGSGVGVGSGSASGGGSDSAASGGEGSATSSASGDGYLGGSDQGEGTGETGGDGSIGGSASSGSGSGSASAGGGGSGDDEGEGTGEGGDGSIGGATSSTSGEASASSGSGDGGGGGDGDGDSDSDSDSGDHLDDGFSLSFSYSYSYAVGSDDDLFPAASFP